MHTSGTRKKSLRTNGLRINNTLFIMTTTIIMHSDINFQETCDSFVLLSFIKESFTNIVIQTLLLLVTDPAAESFHRNG